MNFSSLSWPVATATGQAMTQQFRWRLLILTSIALALPDLSSRAEETVRYKPSSREIVQARLGRYAGNDSEREATLKPMFADAGCDAQHPSEQAAKGSRSCRT